MDSSIKYMTVIYYTSLEQIATLVSLYFLFSVIYNFISFLLVRVCLIYFMPFSEDVTVIILQYFGIC